LHETLDSPCNVHEPHLVVNQIKTQLTDNRRSLHCIKPEPINFSVLVQAACSLNICSLTLQLQVMQYASRTSLII